MVILDNMTIDQMATMWEDMKADFRNITIEANIESVIDSIERLHKTCKSEDLEDLYVEMKHLQHDKDINKHIDKCFDLISLVKTQISSSPVEENLVYQIHYGFKVLEDYIEY